MIMAMRETERESKQARPVNKKLIKTFFLRLIYARNAGNRSERKNQPANNKTKIKKNRLARIVFSHSVEMCLLEYPVDGLIKVCPLGLSHAYTRLCTARNVPRKHDSPSPGVLCKNRSAEKPRKQRRSRNKSLLLFGLSLDGAYTHTFQFHFISQ